jgi:hypothetical protein
MNCQTFCSTLLSFYYNNDHSSSSIDTEEWIIRAIMYHLDSKDYHTTECDHYINYLLDTVVRRKLSPDISERMLATDIQQQIDQLNKATDAIITHKTTPIKTNTKTNKSRPFVSLKRVRPLHHHHQQQQKLKRQKGHDHGHLCFV